MTSPIPHTFRIDLLGIALCVSACAHKSEAPPTIDGSSEATFLTSHAQLVEALSPEDRIRLMLAEIVLLGPKGCVSTEPIPGQPELTQVLGGQANILSCRNELDGMTFEAIMKAADDSQNVVEVSVAEVSGQGHR